MRRPSSIASVVATAIISAACDRPAGPTPPAPTIVNSVPTPAVPTPAVASAVTKPVLKLPLFDDFEGDSLAEFWAPGDYGSGRYEPGAVKITKERARSGRGCVQITVKEGDIEQTGGDGQLTERAELDSRKHAFLGRDVWYGFSFLVPKGFPVVNNRLVIAQWKQGSVRGGPLIAQRFRSGRHDLTIRVPGSFFDWPKRTALPKIVFDQWNDMVYHVRFSSGKDGLVEVWMNGKRVANYAGPIAFPAGEDRFYNKFGLYRDRWKEPMTIYFDNYTLGESFEAVDPTRLK